MRFENLHHFSINARMYLKICDLNLKSLESQLMFFPIIPFKYFKLARIKSCGNAGCASWVELASMRRKHNNTDSSTGASSYAWFFFHGPTHCPRCSLTREGNVNKTYGWFFKDGWKFISLCHGHRSWLGKNPSLYQGVGASNCSLQEAVPTKTKRCQADKDNILHDVTHAIKNYNSPLNLCPDPTCQLCDLTVLTGVFFT